MLQKNLRQKFSYNLERKNDEYFQSFLPEDYQNWIDINIITTVACIVLKIQVNHNILPQSTLEMVNIYVLMTFC